MEFMVCRSKGQGSAWFLDIKAYRSWLSFVFVGLAWTNHHLLRAARQVSIGLMWANLNLLFWLSVLPFVTVWAGETHCAPVPMMVYAADALLAAVAFSVLIHVSKRGTDTPPETLGSRGRIAAPVVAHGVSVLAPVVHPAGVWLSGLCFRAVPAVHGAELAGAGPAPKADEVRRGRAAYGSCPPPLHRPDVFPRGRLAGERTGPGWSRRWDAPGAPSRPKHVAGGFAEGRRPPPGHDRFQ